jgi:hypothetical protein
MSALVILGATGWLLAPRPVGSPLPDPANRTVCRARPASTRARIAADGSPRRWSLNVPLGTARGAAEGQVRKGTRGSSMRISMRSNRGPESRFWWRLISLEVRVHS